jgi:hypothetical protein
MLINDIFRVAGSSGLVAEDMDCKVCCSRAVGVEDKFR